MRHATRHATSTGADSATPWSLLLNVDHFSGAFSGVPGVVFSCCEDTAAAEIPLPVDPCHFDLVDQCPILRFSLNRLTNNCSITVGDWDAARGAPLIFDISGSTLPQLLDGFTVAAGHFMVAPRAFAVATAFLRAALRARTEVGASVERQRHRGVVL